jgi:phospholipase C
MPARRATAAALLAAAIALAAGADARGPCGTRRHHPRRYRHVVWLWMENHGFDDIVGSPDAPYLNQLASACGLARNYHNITHLSLPNYVGAVTGLALPELHPFLLDCNPGGTCLTAATSIFSQARSWRAYEESMPQNCAPSGVSPYGVRHNPPAYLSSLARCADFDVPYTVLQDDLDRDRLPAFAFVTPNNVDNMHDGAGAAAIRAGDGWLARELPKLLASRAYRRGRTAVFVTFDEGEVGGSFAPGEDCAASPDDPSCHVPTIVVSPYTRPGTVSDTRFDHYALLRTSEEMLGVRRRRLLGLAATAASMRRDFRL